MGGSPLGDVPNVEGQDWAREAVCPRRRKGSPEEGAGQERWGIERREGGSEGTPEEENGGGTPEGEHHKTEGEEEESPKVCWWS